jgi:hypothetical protein
MPSQHVLARKKGGTRMNQLRFTAMPEIPWTICIVSRSNIVLSEAASR